MVPLKVLIFIDTAIIGGPGRGLMQLWRFHDRSRFQLEFVTFKVAGRGSSEFIDTFRALGAPVTVIEQAGVLDFGFFKKGLLLLDSDKNCLLQSHNYKSHLLAAFLKWRRGLPWIAFTHGWTAENFKVKLYHALDRVLLPFANHIIAVSPPLKTAVSAWVDEPQSVSLIENAIDRDCIAGSSAPSGSFRTAQGVQPDHFLIACIGRLSFEKGQRELLRAWKIIVSQRESGKLRLALIGDGPDRKELETMVSELGIRDSVMFAGYQAGMADIYRSINALVIPSLSEGLPNVMLEAMSFSIPVVATTVGAIPSVIEHGTDGLLVPPADPNMLSDAILQLFRDPVAAQRMTEKAYKKIEERFDPKARVASIERIYAAIQGVVLR